MLRKTKSGKIRVWWIWEGNFTKMYKLKKIKNVLGLHVFIVVYHYGILFLQYNYSVRWTNILCYNLKNEREGLFQTTQLLTLWEIMFLFTISQQQQRNSVNFNFFLVWKKRNKAYSHYSVGESVKESKLVSCSDKKIVLDA